jgi:hypothetical protein
MQRAGGQSCLGRKEQDLTNRTVFSFFFFWFVHEREQKIVQHPVSSKPKRTNNNKRKRTKTEGRARKTEDQKKHDDFDEVFLGP